ncbi:RNA-binding KH domain-containing protein PEPPER-like [Hibiscus syriacus]|uniref:RNA-binding KH domain-containing protein PEPPER-like n=1 Tax=Hibiscus syriacus TaxID=106335 RepID=UPI001923A49F|nr:RNA-binding KH domain-containing protein PEPPER-like [Hibiscus syriacus]
MKESKFKGLCMYSSFSIPPFNLGLFHRLCMKVDSIIGRKGEVIKKMCEETSARIRVLDCAVGTPDCIMIISGKEEPEAPLSPAMDATIRVFKRVHGLQENDADAKAAGATFCSIRLLAASTQAISLIGKQCSLIKSLYESTGASVRGFCKVYGEHGTVFAEETPPYVVADERIVELQGEALKVLKAPEAVVGHLRKFLVDQIVLPLFEKTHNAVVTQELQAETRDERSSLHTVSQGGIGVDLPLTARRDFLFLEHEKQFESQIPSSGIPFYGQDLPHSIVHSSSGLHRSAVPIVTQEFISIQQDPIRRRNYRDTSYRSPFSQLGSNISSLSSQTYGGYGGSSSVSGYSTFRL